MGVSLHPGRSLSLGFQLARLREGASEGPQQDGAPRRGRGWGPGVAGAPARRGGEGPGVAGALNGVREAKQRGLGRTAGRGRSRGWRPDRVAPAGTRLPRLRLSLRQVLHEPLIDEDPVFIATCTERELRKRKKRKFSLWVRQCSSTGFIVQVGRAGGQRGAGRAGHASAHVPAHGACRVLRQRLDAGWGRPRPSGRQGGRPRPRHGPSAHCSPRLC